MLLRASVLLAAGFSGAAVLATERDRPASLRAPTAADPAQPKRDPTANKVTLRLTLAPPAGQCSIPPLNALKGAQPFTSRMPTVKPPKEGYAMRQAVMPAPPCQEVHR